MNDGYVPERRPALLAFLAWLGFVVYGSLVPFDYRPYGLDQALERFAAIGYLDLGVVSRADWIANIVLYVPLAWLGCAWAMGLRSHHPWRYLAGLGVLGLCVAVAVAVEFTQIFFAPRTVSLNDLLAETLGSGAGVALFALGRHQVLGLWDAFLAGGRRSLVAVAVVFFLGYVALSLFPYDFVLSSQELAWKLETGGQGWFLAEGCGSPLRCLARQVGEGVAIAPLGVLAVLAVPALSARRLFVAGVLLGLVLEGLQLLLASGSSQGLSLLWRGLGLAAGGVLGRVLHRQGGEPLARLIRRAAPWVALPYALLLVGLGGWFSASWLTFEGVLARLAEVRFLPFYYHYFTTETAALGSVLAQAGLYAPVGGLAWAKRSGAVAAAGWGAALALPIELGKLWVLSTHPDPTNLLIAGGAAGLACVFFGWLFAERPARPGRSVPTVPDTVAEPKPVLAPVLAWFRGFPPLRWAALAWAGAALASLWDYPLAWGVPVLLALAVAMWRWRGAWLVVVPATLPWLDFSFLSGRLYWSEFDTLLLFALATVPASGRVRRSARHPERLWLGLFAVSALVGLVVGLWPLAPLDANAFTHYTSPYNALRAVKGLLFALAFWGPLRAEWRADAGRATDRLALGMVLGLAAELACVVWERAVYPGLWDFASDYRVTGSFPGMNVGGASIEAYLVLALPFLWLWAWRRRRLWVGLAAGGLYAVGAYAVMVTFARGGQAAFILAALLGGLGFARLFWTQPARAVPGMAAIPVVALLAGLVVWPVLGGGFSQSRLATIDTDIGIRAAHWRDALAILGQAGNSWWGAGLGSFPAAFYWYSSAPSRPATYGFEREDGNTFLSLGSGESLYFEQVVAVEPGRGYRIALDMRSREKPAGLAVSLCEKGLLYSFACVWGGEPPWGGAGRWEHYELAVRTDGFGPRRSVKLSLRNQAAGTVVDVDNVALIDDAGRDLVRNGGFVQGMRYWFFTTDSHLAWHAKNLFVHVLFEQGWPGLVAFVALLASALGLSLRRSKHDALALTVFIALVSFLAVGLIDSLIDEPRLAFLFFFWLSVALIAGRQDGPASPRSFHPARGRMG